MEKYFNSIILLLFLSPIFCSESSEILDNLANYGMICSNKDEGCSFNVTKDYPISPKIPTSIPTKAILSDYRYIYLRFSIPREQNQKTFYLEAYYTSNGETIISNGDCYYINTNQNNDYEIRIYKKLKKDDYIRFGFLGIPSNFEMTVQLQFKLSISLYFNDIALTDSKSLYKANISSLIEYLEEDKKNIDDQKNREKMLKETLSILMKDIFDISIDLNAFEDPDSFFSSMVIPDGPYYFLTVSYSVGLELSTNNRFQPEKNILSETTVRGGKIESYYDGLDFLDDDLYISKDAYKVVELFNKIISGLISKLRIQSDFTLTLSTDDDNTFIINTFKFYLEKTELINYEIQIKIQFIEKLKELATLQVKQYAYLPYRGIDNPELSNFSLKEKKIRYLLSGIYYAIGINNIIKKDITSVLLVPILIKDIDFAELGGTFLDMVKDENGVYHATFDCWQQHFGYTKFHDFIFDTFTDMRKNNDGMFTYNHQTYILWAWKGDYINLGAGAELGIYYGGRSKDSYYDFWKVDKSLAMPMTLTLTHKNYGTIVDNWNNEGNDSWWITAFNPKYKKIKADDLTAYYTVKFKNEDMFNEFAKTKSIGWSYDNVNKIASLIL